MVRALNEAGGRNRLKFQKLNSRVKHARKRVDVVHKVRAFRCVMCGAGVEWDGMGWDGGWMGWDGMGWGTGRAEVSFNDRNIVT